MERDLRDWAEAWALDAHPELVKDWVLDVLAAMQAMVFRAIVCVQSVAPKLNTIARYPATQRNAHHAGQ